MAEFIWNLSLWTPIPVLELYKLGCGPRTLFSWAPCAALRWPGDPQGVEHTPRSGVAMPAPLFPAGSPGSPRPGLRWGRGAAKPALSSGDRISILWRPRAPSAPQRRQAAPGTLPETMRTKQIQSVGFRGRQPGWHSSSPHSCCVTLGEVSQHLLNLRFLS